MDIDGILTGYSYVIWLVVEPYPSEKWWSSSVGMIIPNIWKVIKVMIQTSIAVICPTIWKNISQWVGLSHILWKIKFVFQTTNQYPIVISEVASANACTERHAMLGPKTPVPSFECPQVSLW